MSYQKRPHNPLIPMGRTSRHQRGRIAKRFRDRLRFDQPTRTWIPPEPRSYPPSYWPAVQEAAVKWGLEKAHL